MNSQVMTVEAAPSLVRMAHVYALHAVGLAQVQSRLRCGFQSSRRGRFRRPKSFAPTDWCARNG